jgi:hypothetical protein
MRQSLQGGWSTKIILYRVKDILSLTEKLSSVRAVSIMTIYQNSIMELDIVLNVYLTMRLVPCAKVLIMLLI